MLRSLAVNLSFLLISLLVIPSINPVLAQKDWKDLQPGRCVRTVDSHGQTYDDVATIQGLECIFYNVLQVIVYLAGISFFIMFIIGGFQYLFSSGDQKKVAASSSTLTMAIIGLIGIIGSWLILKFIQSFTGLNVTDFIIPS